MSNLNTNADASNCLLQKSCGEKGVNTPPTNKDGSNLLLDTLEFECPSCSGVMNEETYECGQAPYESIVRTDTVMACSDCDYCEPIEYEEGDFTYAN